ncbi:hypothetical protein SH16_01750 [Aeromonas caviae]|uniref:hypothetical protein n=1 Tax=Aeromonas caviae TaxID=648 RepID=UPI0006506D4B|nr:hypothetical protein [Aeromonas caviae]KLV46265.1 hypothetical protein SH16_01750 [Aeromonas caviae]MEE1913345.1 hypothetical protein [Aeromonas caviae]
MKLPLIDVFSKPYVKKTYREATEEEINYQIEKNGGFNIADLSVEDKIIAKVNTPLEAANYISTVTIDNALDSHIDDALLNSVEFKQARKMMPAKTPPALLKQKTNSSPEVRAKANAEINNFGVVLAEEQFLFHGGQWDHTLGAIQTTTPLSTSFCPQVALRNADHNGKAFNNERIDILVLKAKEAKTKAFVYNRRGRLKNEKEVILSAGADITVKKITKISDNYACSLDGTVVKEVPVYVIEAEIS